MDDLRLPSGGAHPRRNTLDAPEPGRWEDAHDAWVGAPAAIAFVLARSPTATVTVSDVVAYPLGFEFELTVVGPGEFERGGKLASPRPGRPDGGETPDEVCRFGLMLPNGRLLADAFGTIAGPREHPSSGEEMFAYTSGGGGAPSVMRWRMWVQPLPSSGRLQFLFEWPAHEIAETRHAIDAQLITRAAARAIPSHLRPPAERSSGTLNGDFFEPETRKSHRRSDRSRPLSRGENELSDLAPRRWLGVPLDRTLVLASTEDALVVISRFAAFPWGFTFVLSVRAAAAHAAALQASLFHESRMPLSWRRAVGAGRLSPQLLRVGVRDANEHEGFVDRWNPLLRHSEDPEAPVIEQWGGSASEGRADVGYHVLALPPPGPIVFACEWPALRVALTSAAIDADELRTAAARAVEIWPPPTAARG